MRIHISQSCPIRPRVQRTDESGYDRDNLDLELFDPAQPLGQEVEVFGTLPTWARGDFYPHVFWMPSGAA